MAKRKRLRKAEKPSLKQRLRKIGRGIVGLGAYGAGLYAGMTLLGGRFAPPLTPKEIDNLYNYEHMLKRKREEGWHVKRSKALGEDTFKRGHLVITRAPYNIHVRYIDMHLFDGDYKDRTDSFRAMTKIMNDQKLLDKWMKEGEKWIW